MFSDWIIYADESGDHSLRMIDPYYPVFALAFCIFRKSDYLSIAEPRFANLKFAFWGHDLTVFHSHKIRKQIGDFAIFNDRDRRRSFLSQLSTAIDEIPFTVVGTVLDKRSLIEDDLATDNPYEIALWSCLKQTDRFLGTQGNNRRIIHLVVESRGKSEDDKLKSSFNEMLQASQSLKYFQLKFAHKQMISTGLQLADLVAYPMGKHIIYPEKDDPSWNIVEKKLFNHPDPVGYGLTTYETLLEQRLETLIRGVKAKNPGLTEV